MIRTYNEIVQIALKKAKENNPNTNDLSFIIAYNSEFQKILAKEYTSIINNVTEYSNGIELSLLSFEKPLCRIYTKQNTLYIDLLDESKYFDLNKHTETHIDATKYLEGFFKCRVPIKTLIFLSSIIQHIIEKSKS